MSFLRISNIPSLVELPSSFQNLSKLNWLDIKNCKNLETLPKNINFEDLESLDLSGCSRLRSFPNFSRNIIHLLLDFTAIEEVPGWIGKFSRLEALSMENCRKLRRVSLNIFKLKYFRNGQFSDCGALTEANWDDDDSPSDVAITTTDDTHYRPFDPFDWSDSFDSSLPDMYIPMVQLHFFRCFNFDHKALFQQETVFKGLILSGEEVPSYFTHRSNGTCVTNIPLPHFSLSQQLRFEACTLCDVKSVDRQGALHFQIQVCFRFIDISGEHFDYADLPRSFFTKDLGDQLVMFDFCLPLNKDITPQTDQLNYDHVDIQFRLTDEDNEEVPELHFKGCGILLLENNGGGSTSNDAYLGRGRHETEESDGFVGSDVETLRNSNQMWVRLLSLFCCGLRE